MSTFTVPIVLIGKIEKHPNADTLSLTEVQGETVIFRTGDYQEGDLAIYAPEDAVVPVDLAGTEFLGDKRRIRAKKLRGVFSCGLLLKLGVLQNHVGLWRVNDDVSGVLGITKWEEPESFTTRGEVESDPGFMPKYDVESIRKFSSVLQADEPVVVTEKIHGTNFRAVYRDGRLWVGSHHRIVRVSDQNLYWQAAKQQHLTDKLAKAEGIALYGEVFGQVQDLKYDCRPGQILFAAFDAYDTVKRRWLDWPEFRELCERLLIPMVPVLYQGPYQHDLIAQMVEGKSAIASHNKEGIVVKPQKDRWDRQTGRVLLKWVSQWYRTRKGGTEHH